jgi:hypothetical protein
LSGLPSQMGELMATLLVIVDAWYELAIETAPERFPPAARYEVLGLLVRLLARRFNGFRHAPRAHEVRAVVRRDCVGLILRAPGRALADAEAVERELATFGFRVRPTGAQTSELLIAADNLQGARVLAFPGARARFAHGRRP